MAIDYDLLKEIKSRADIVDVISSFLPSVQKKGKNYVALCPFHDDNDPSMQINKDRQTFKCFVCQTGGDVFTFVQKYDKCSFEEAVRKVCDIIGFDDPRLHKKTYSAPVDANLVPVYGCITDLQKFYEYGLTTDEGLVARNYLDGRGLNQEQRAKFSLGYAFNDGKMSINYLQKKGYSLKNIEDIGICRASTNMSDNNAGRLIFPIKDHNGQVVGFSARKMSKDDDSPKYVNSPETKIFTKGKVLYNYHNAKQTARHDGYVYVVEGFMDVFAFDSIGITSCVALMSTKVTPFHIDMLRRLGCEIRLCLDGDKPGQEAMMKIISQFDEAGLQYRLVSSPGELRDPDEILKQSGEDELKKYVSTLVDSFSFALNFYKNYAPLGSKEDKKKVVLHFGPMLAKMKSSFEQNDYIYKLADVTGFAPQAIKDYVAKLSGAKVNKTIEDQRTFVPKSNINKEKIDKEHMRLAKAEQMILNQMFVSQEAIDFFEKELKFFVTHKYQLLAQVILECSDGKGVSISDVISMVNASDSPNKDELLDYLSNQSFLEQTAYNHQILIDCKRVIDSEKVRLENKHNFSLASEGKSAQEKARLLNDYIQRTQK